MGNGAVKMTREWTGISSNNPRTIYHYHYAYSPRVIIYKSHGAYKIHIEDDDDQDVEIIVLR